MNKILSVLCILACANLCFGQPVERLSFPVTKAKAIRIVVRPEAGQGVQLDEVEAFGPRNVERNYNRPFNGAVRSAVSSAAEFKDRLFDGLFGAENQWTAAKDDAAPTVEIEFYRVLDLTELRLSANRIASDQPAGLPNVEIWVRTWGDQPFHKIEFKRESVEPAAHLLSWDLAPVPGWKNGAFPTFYRPDQGSNSDPAAAEVGLSPVPSPIPATWPKDDLDVEDLALKGKAAASACIAGYPIHQIAHLNDGQFGNSHSWIAPESAPNSWAEIDLGKPYYVYSVALGSDSEAKYTDRMVRNYRILTACEYEADSNAKTWTPVVPHGPELSVRTPLYFNPVQARYIRVAFENAPGVRIDEFEIYGTEAPLTDERLAILKPRFEFDKASQSQPLISKPVDENQYWRQFDASLVGEEYAWLKAYGRAALDPRLANNHYSEPPRHAQQNPDDVTALVTVKSTAIQLDGRLQDPIWKLAPGGTVRVARIGAFDVGVYAPFAVQAFRSDGYLYVAIEAPRLLDSLLAVVRTPDAAVPVYAYRPANADPIPEAVYLPGPDGSIGGNGTVFEFRVPLERLPGADKGLCVQTGFGGMYTNSALTQSQSVVFLPGAVGVRADNEPRNGLFPLTVTNFSDQPVRLAGLARAFGAENQTPGIDDDLVPFDTALSGSGLSKYRVLADGFVLAAGESRTIQLPAYDGPLGDELEILIAQLTDGGPNGAGLANAQTRPVRLNLFRYDPAYRTIRLTRSMLNRLPDVPQKAEFLKRFDQIEKRFAQGSNRSLFRDARLLKRSIQFSDPRLTDLKTILFEKRHALEPSHNYSDCYDNRWQTGGGIFRLTLNQAEDGSFEPEKGTLETLYQTTGMVRHPIANFDLSKLYFTERLSMQDYWHIFEMNPDGTGLKRLTSGPFNDLYPTPLPDGGLAMISSRCKLKFLCWEPQALTLCRMNADGTNVQQLSYANLTEFAPSVSRDGRILFTRSEYLDKGADFGHTLWYITPTGTAPELTFGNTIAHPQGYANGREVPGANEILTVLISHFGDLNGPVCYLDLNKGRFSQEAIRSVTPEVCWPGFSALRESFREPYPIATDFFVVSHAPESRFGLFLLDRFGNRDLIYMDETFGSMCPIPYVKRPVPTVLGPTFDTQLAARDRGVLWITDVYEGISDKVERGSAKYLRVASECPSPLERKPDGSYQFAHKPFMEFYAGPVDKVSGPFGWPSYVAKGDWGLAEIESDGSVSVEAPAGKVLFFELLDENYNEIQRMRSVVQLQPGESRSCIGCHEDRNMTPKRVQTIARQKKPQTLQAPPWGAGPFDYRKIVQPILDQQCIACHAPEKSAAKFNLTARTDQENIPVSYHTFIENGWVHHFNWSWGGGFPYKAEPYSFGTVRSRVWDVLKDENHKTVRLTSEQERAIKAWTDLSCPLWPDYTQRSRRTCNVPE